jgi:hypothetical protein
MGFQGPEYPEIISMFDDEISSCDHEDDGGELKPSPEYREPPSSDRVWHDIFKSTCSRHE